jgi:hypothetical protein
MSVIARMLRSLLKRSARLLPSDFVVEPDGRCGTSARADDGDR